MKTAAAALGAALVLGGAAAASPHLVAAPKCGIFPASNPWNERVDSLPGNHTVLLVTHNSAVAAMADRVVWLHSGTVSRQQRVKAPVDPRTLEW